jgi:hypothetical protein
MPGRVYRLVIDGDLPDSAASEFEDMAVARGNGRTVLFGAVRDQSELHGLIHRVADLGLTLISVQALASLGSLVR